MSRYQRIFGAGPAGSFISVLLLAVAVFLAEQMDGPRITGNDVLRHTVFAVLALVTVSEEYALATGRFFPKIRT